MTRTAATLAALVLFLSSPGVALAQTVGSFAVAQVFFEQNATDKDVEIVFEAMGGRDGLLEFNVVAPDGRKVVDFTTTASPISGIRQFRFETPEPTNAAALKTAYPEGVYTFTGATASGSRLRGSATLNHQLPAPVSIVQPKPEAEDVPAGKTEIRWTPVKGLAAYVVYVEQDELGVNLTARLPGSATSFVVPDGFLRPGTEYTLGVGTVTEKGNASFVETTFTTVGKP